MLDVRRLTLLREVALHSGVSGAARALGMSASSVSQQVSRLQQETGVLLLEPAGRGVRLTADAERLVAHAERVIEVLEEAEVELQHRRGNLTGTVRMVAFHTFASRLLTPTLRHLRRSAPNLSLEFVELDPEEAIRELTARRADLAIADEYPGFPLPPHRGAVRTEFGLDPIELYLPESVDASRLDDEHLAETLAGLPWVMEPRGTGASRWALSLCRSIGFEPRIAFESPSLDVHRTLVAEGVAAALLPRSVAGDLSERIPRVPSVTAGLHRTFLSLMRRGTERSPALLAVHDAVEAAYVEL